MVPAPDLRTPPPVLTVFPASATVKLRIQGDSLRLRLTRPEVARLAATGAVIDAMHVAPGARLAYGLRATDGDALGVEMDGAGVTVLVPRAWLGEWADGDEVGFSGSVDAGDGRSLALLVEKDFDCLHRRADEPDAFPNPLADGATDADAG